MSSLFPPMPPRDQLRSAAGNLVVRPAEVEDAQAIFELKQNPTLPFLRDVNRPRSFEDLRDSIQRLHAHDNAGNPAEGLYWIFELNGQFAGVFDTRFEMRTKNGERTGLLLRTAIWQAYFAPEFIRQGLAKEWLTSSGDDVLMDLLVRHFGVEQDVFWAEDANESIRAVAATAGFEGPLNYNHSPGVGFYRRRTRPLSD